MPPAHSALPKGISIRDLMTKADFLATAARAALASSHGLPPGIAVAQAALESNWGQSQLARDAHNYFGIKAHAGHPRVAYPTFEHMNGRDLRLSAEFARYGSMEECFADRDRLLAGGACYAGARASRANPEAFARALAVHWATDPHYADKLLRVYRDHHLDELDVRSPDRPVTGSPDSQKEQT
jgi:flagellum-specific peptidoglycan hydrolase FlgJ